MTEVKVGQVWKSNLTGIEYTVRAIGDNLVSVLRPVGTSIDRSAFDGEIFAMIKDSEPKASDLEIVQKALDKSRLYFVLDTPSVFYDQYVAIDSMDSLITWAKQQLGE